jgi:hypothetical protein
MRSINPIRYIALAVKEISIQQANDPNSRDPFSFSNRNLPSATTKKNISNC